MTGGEVTLGALPAEQEIAAQTEGARERIAELTALLDGFDTAADEIRITRKTPAAVGIRHAGSPSRPS
jgi:hypothetical protein